MATDFFKIGRATGQQFTDVSGAVQRGLEAGLKPFAEYEKSRKERVEALGRILQTTPNLEELPKIPAQYFPKISEWTSSAKNEYADAARALVQMSPETAEYRETVQKMNSIKTAFVNLDNQLNGIREERIEYLNDYQNGLVSKGFKNSDIEAAYGVNGAIAEIDANGNVSMTGNEGKAFAWSERQEHYNVNPYIQKSMVDLSTNAKSNGLKGISFTQDEYKEQLKAIMSDPRIGNIQGLKSLIYDDIDGTALNIVETNPEILELLEAATPDLPLIKQKLVDVLAPALADVNQTSLSKYNDALQASRGGTKLTISEQKRLQILDLYNKSLPQIRPTLTSFLNSNKTAQDAINNFSKLGLNVTDQVQDDDGNIIAVTVKHGLVDEPTQISLTDPVAAEVGLSNALGYSILGGVYTPQTTTEPEQTPADTPEGPTLLNPTSYPEEITNLPNTRPSDLNGFIKNEILKYKNEIGPGRSISSRVADIKRKIRRLPENQTTEKTIARIIYDTYFREKENKRRTSEFEKSEGLNLLLKNINEASTQALGASALERKNINAVLNAVNKEDAFELTEQDFLIYEYIEQGGSIEDIANNSDDIDKTFA